MMKLLKKIWPDVAAVVFFVAVAFAYFMPAVTEGRILSQHDSVAGIGSGEEARQYMEHTGERTRWTNAIFGGMPTYQMAPSYDSTDTLKIVEGLYRLYLPSYVWHVFIMLLGFYILMRVWKLNAWLAVLGAVMWAFSSYFFIIIAAGHIWKFITLAYVPPTIAGMVLIYRRKYLWGGLLTALFVALQILANHVQMSYYFMFVMLAMVVAYGVTAYREKRMPDFVRATAVLLLSGLMGVLINLSNLYHTYEYSKETIRGKSELVKQSTADQTKSGLDRSYITQWSYGIGETWSLLVPNVKGGASVPLAANETAMQKANPMYSSIYSQIGQYWGEQPGTSGPVYVGAFVCFLFVLGLFLVEGPMKWALAAATLLSILLSWGKNFMPMTDLFLDFVPMYDKFRAVSSILVIAEFTIPALAMLTLKKIIERSALLREKTIYFCISFALTGGAALVFAVMPGLFFPDYVSTMEMKALQSIPTEQLVPLLANLEQVRKALFTADAWRSFFIVTLGAVLLILLVREKINARVTVVALTVLCLADMWAVNKRYLYDEQFVDKSEQVRTFEPTETDKLILQDKALDYRVLKLAEDAFSENNTAYWHKSVGGYHAAKLRRYQELIDEHIRPEMQALYREIVEADGNMDEVDATKFGVINMLNTKYVILPLQGGQTLPVENPYVLGNAWFVNNVQWVEDANEEIAQLHNVDLTETAVVDKKFATILISGATSQDSVKQVKLTRYEPNELEYEVASGNGGVVVFSEIYYPGWQATIDGELVDHGRANYVLRALQVPAGKHVVKFEFRPKSLQITETIAFVVLAVLALVFILACGITWRKSRNGASRC